MSNKLYCRECGEENKVYDKFCGECGNPLHESVKASNSKKENELSKEVEIWKDIDTLEASEIKYEKGGNIFKLGDIAATNEGKAVRHPRRKGNSMEALRAQMANYGKKVYSDTED